MQKQSSFIAYQQIKKSAIKTLVNAGLTIREAITTLKKDIPHLFNGKKQWDSIDSQNSKFSF